MNQEKVLLVILDGFGEGKDYEGNAITRANTPNLKHLRATYPMSLLKAHGNAVGLPEIAQGNSEVGHFTMGSGRITFQSLEEINRSIANGSLYTKQPLLDAVAYIKKSGKSALHLLGMISDEGVHAHTEHLFALLKFAKDQGVEKTYIHAITDGRDVPERSAEKYITMIQEKITELGMGEGSSTQAKITTIVGRFFAMDRDNNWDRTEKAYDLIVGGEGVKETDPLAAIQNAYARDIKTDYYIDPIMLDEHGVIKDKDAVIFFNFRTDRTRQLTNCFTREKEIGFTPKKTVTPFFVCMGDYSVKAPVVFPTPVITNNLAEVLSKNNVPQLRVAETEKYAHVTYFFNSQIEAPYAKEDRIMIDSKKAKSFAEIPEMSAKEITDRLLEEMDKGDHPVIIVNYANCDLVGHSGDYKASLIAVETIDECLGRIEKKSLETNYQTFITGDHGNVEYMIYDEGPEKGQQCPSHTRNPVPLILISEKFKGAKLANGELQDVAPTLLAMLGIKSPEEMTGKNILTL